MKNMKEVVLSPCLNRSGCDGAAERLLLLSAQFQLFEPTANHFVCKSKRIHWIGLLLARLSLARGGGAPDSSSSSVLR